MPIDVQKISIHQVSKVLATQEGHFSDVKAIEVAPGKLTETLSAFANADGGDLYIGIDELKPSKIRHWRGFPDQEAANGHIQALETLFPLGSETEYTFLNADGQIGLVLQVSVRKTLSIKRASDRNIYVRRGAQKRRLTSNDDIRRLEFAKGIESFENELTQLPMDEITNSTEIIEFMLEVVPFSEPEVWLKKQQLIREGRVNVCGVLLFSEEPQAALPKRCGIKVYRYTTMENTGSRETLVFNPLTIEGPVYQQILHAIGETINIVEQAPALGLQGLENVRYPRETIHEILTNAVIHRDYSIADDIHIRIFENRIEIESPGRLPAHVTPENILAERFSRNGNLVRLLNKYPTPPNKDVGEGLNTAFAAMRRIGLKDPDVINRENSVLVIIRHERLASHEAVILEFLEENEAIANKKAREICFVDADYKMRRIFARLEDRGLIEKTPGTIQAKTSYRKGPRFSDWRTHLEGRRRN